MKRLTKTAIIFAVVTVLLLGASFAAEAVERSRFPEGGVYFARTDSYYSYSSRSLNPVISLICFDVKKGGALSLFDYHEIALVDTAGVSHKSKDVSISHVFTDIFFSRLAVRIVLDRTDFEDNTATYFQTVRLTDAHGKERDFSIGRICIEALNAEEEVASLSFGGYTTGANEMKSYNLRVTNQKEDLRLSRLSLDLEGITYQASVYDEEGNVFPLDGYLLSKGTSVNIVLSFAGNTEAPFHFIKPCLVYERGGKVYAASVTGASDYISLFDREETVKYLWERADV